MSSKSRSISEIVLFLRTSFRDVHFREAEEELKLLEEKLRSEKVEIETHLTEKIDVLEAECQELERSELLLKEELKRLRRECEISDEKVNDLTRDLSLTKEKEGKTSKRCQRYLEDTRALELEKDGLCQKLKEKEEEIKELRKINEGLEMAKREFEGLKKENEILKEERAKFDAKIEELQSNNREKDERIKEFDEMREILLIDKRECIKEKDVKINELVKEKDGYLEDTRALKLEKEGLCQKLKEKEEEINELRKINEGLEMAKKESEAEFNVRLELFEGVQKENEILKEERAKFDTKIEEVQSNNREKDERIKEFDEMSELLQIAKRECIKEKDVKINELVKEKEQLDMEKREAVAKLKKLEEQLSKLEGDVATWMCLNVPGDKKLGNTQIQKVLSGISKALDSEQISFTCNDGNLHEPETVPASPITEPKSCSNSGLEYEKSPKRELIFDEELIRENEATCIKKTALSNIIDISDSDDDNETPLHINGLKRNRTSKSSSEEDKDHGSSDDSLHPKLKTKKLTHLLHEPSIVASNLASNPKFVSPQRQPMVAIRKCQEKLDGNCKGTRCHDFPEDEVDTICSPQVKELIASSRRRRASKIWARVEDIKNALDRDPELCAKAICTLYRQNKYRFSLMQDLICSGGFLKVDVDRVIALAEFLIDGSPGGGMKKSVNDLKEHDPSSLSDCKRLAIKYSKQLFEIYRKKEDAYFSPI